jgi:galactosamine-6-phosphate isomerase
VLKLDEWGGLPKGDPGSCEAYLQERVVRAWGISRGSFEGFAGGAARAKTECKRIQDWLARNGPVDICILGLGLNGHLGLNEPGNFLCPVAHRAALTRQSRAHTMLAHRITKPEYGLTLGMAEILDSRQILLLVSGAEKQRALQRLLRGEIATQFPASLLGLHSRAHIFCDREAALARRTSKK